MNPLKPSDVNDPSPPEPPPGLAPDPPLRPPSVVPPKPSNPEVVVMFPKLNSANPPFDEVILPVLLVPGFPPTATVPIESEVGTELVDAIALNQVDPPEVAGFVLFAGAPLPPVPTL